MIVYDGKEIIVDIRADNFAALADLAKEFNGVYDGKEMNFTFPPTKRLVRELLKFEPESNWNPRFRTLVEKVKKSLPSLFSNFELSNKLYPFQKEDVLTMLSWKTNVLLASDLGTGKTAVTASFINNIRDRLPCLVICTATLKLNWKKEIELWAPGLRAMVINGQHSYMDEEFVECLKDYDILIFNYDILGEPNKVEEDKVKEAKKAFQKEEEARKKKFQKEEEGSFHIFEEHEKKRREECTRNGTFFIPGTYKKKRYKPKYFKAPIIPVIGWVDVIKENIDYKTVVCDECQFIETPKTIRARAVRQLAERGDILKVCISGTPYETKLAQFFNVLNLLQPGIFPNEWAFKMRYCGAQRGYFGYEFKGLTHPEELRAKLSKFMIRRKIEDVLPQLPENQRTVIYLDLEENARHDYEQLENNFVYTKGNKLTELTKLKQFVYKAKLQPAIDFIDNLINTQGKVVAFAYHTEVYKELRKHYASKAVGIDGSTSATERENAKTSFQEDENIKVFVGQIEAASAGITLTASHIVVFLEFGKTVGEHIQAEGRIRRIGQKSLCTSYYLIVPESIDEDRMYGISEHHKDITGIMDGNLGKDATTMFEEDDLDTIAKERIKRRVIARRC